MESPSDTWTQMASESVDRCYHSTAVLLPDGRVFSGGGGEWAPATGVANSPQDTHSDAQLFSPPYLFQGARPVLTQAPGYVTYGQEFRVTTATPEDIAQVTWIRLPSVTHSFDQNQRINFLVFALQSDGLGVIAPPSSNVCPPGHYMLFILGEWFPHAWLRPLGGGRGAAEFDPGLRWVVVRRHHGSSASLGR